MVAIDEDVGFRLDTAAEEIDGTFALDLILDVLSLFFIDEVIAVD